MNKKVQFTDEQFKAIKPGDRFRVRHSAQMSSGSIVYQMTRNSKAKWGASKNFKRVNVETNELSDSSIFNLRLIKRKDRITASIGDMYAEVYTWEPVEYDRKAFKVQQRARKAIQTDFKLIQKIVKNHQFAEVDGILIDVQTANVILTIHKKIRPEHRKQFEAMKGRKLVGFSQSVMAKFK